MPVKLDVPSEKSVPGLADNREPGFAGVPLPLIIPVTVVFKVIIGEATVPANPLRVATESKLTDPGPEYKVDQTGLAGVPVLTWQVTTVVLKIVSPVAGSVMASLCTVVILGIRNPFEVLLTSSIALVSGILPVELIETF
jgi:hypothetical protein